MFIDLVYAQDLENGTAKLYQAPGFSRYENGTLVVAENDKSRVLSVVDYCTIDPESSKFKMIVRLNRFVDIPKIIGKFDTVTYTDAKEDY